MRLPNEFSADNMGFDKVIWNTAIYMTGATIFSILSAALLAWRVERSDMPGKMRVHAGVPLGIAVPGILHAIAWVLLLSPPVRVRKPNLHAPDRQHIAAV